MGKQKADFTISPSSAAKAMGSCFRSVPGQRAEIPLSPLDSLGVEQEVSPWPTGAVQCKRQSKYMVDDGQPQAQLRQADASTGVRFLE